MRGSVAGNILLLLATLACESPPRAGAPEPSPRPSASSEHADHDEAEAHRPVPRQPAPSATQLSEASSAALTTLRISAHLGSVIVRKRAEGWVVGSERCIVTAARMERALRNLSALHAVSTDERPVQGSDFELQIVALQGETAVLHLQLAGRSQGSDLLQLPDSSTFRLRGLDRELWSADAARWCAP